MISWFVKYGCHKVSKVRKSEENDKNDKSEEKMGVKKKKSGKVREFNINLSHY